MSHPLQMAIFPFAERVNDGTNVPSCFLKWNNKSFCFIFGFCKSCIISCQKKNKETSAIYLDISSSSACLIIISGLFFTTPLILSFLPSFTKFMAGMACSPRKKIINIFQSKNHTDTRTAMRFCWSRKIWNFVPYFSRSWNHQIAQFSRIIFPHLKKRSTFRTVSAAFFQKKIHSFLTF